MKAVIAISGAKSKKTKGVKIGISKIANYNSSWIKVNLDRPVTALKES